MSPTASPTRRGHRLRTLDFTRPTKFSNDQQRRIERAMETFCQTAGTRLSSELRWPVELEMLGTNQQTWAGAQTALSPDALPVLIEVEPLATRMLLSIENAFVLACLEALLGGTPERPARDRRLSEIDWSLATKLLESIIGPLSTVWEEIGGITLRPGEIDPTDAAQLASVSEPTYSVTLECRCNQESFILTLLVPWISVEPVANQLSGREPARRRDDPHREEPITRAMSGVQVAMRAEVASIELTIEEILALKPGDVIAFGTPAGDGVTLFAENTPLAVAAPGASGARRAVQVTGPAARP